MKNVDVKKLEIEAVRKMFKLGVADVCPELLQEFLAIHGMITPDPGSQKSNVSNAQN